MPRPIDQDPEDQFPLKAPEGGEGEGEGESGDQGTQSVGTEGAGDKGDAGEQTFKVGDKEFTADQLEKIVQKASQFESLNPEYTRVTQEMARLKKEKEENSRKANQTEGERATADAAQRAFELLKPAFEKMVKTMMGTQSENSKKERRGEQLEKEISGKDGRPAFKKDEIEQYAKDNGLTGDIEDIYEKKYRKELRDYYRKQGIQKKPKPTFSEDPGKGVHLPKGKNFKTMTTEEAKKAGVEFLKSLEH